MSATSLLRACRDQVEQDLWWYWLCAPAALGLHGLPLDGLLGTGGGDTEPDLTPRMQDDVRRSARIRDALRRVVPEYRSVLERCYTARGLSAAQLERWRVAAGYVLHVARECSEGRTPSWVHEELDWAGVWRRSQRARAAGRHERARRLLTDAIETEAQSRARTAHVAYRLGLRHVDREAAERERARRAAAERAREAVLERLRGEAADSEPADTSWYVAAALRRLGLG